MATDMLARILAAQALGYANNVIDQFGSGFAFRGAVDYYSDLPDSGNEAGDLYLVKYSGSSGTTPLNAEYAWGDDGGTDGWIQVRGDIPYTLSFNSTTDWTENGDGYAITVLGSTHGKGADAQVSVWRSDGSGGYVRNVGTPTDGYSVAVESTANVTLSVTGNTRFAGKLVIN